MPQLKTLAPNLSEQRGSGTIDIKIAGTYANV
jgi:hypothetical protein